MFLPGFFSVVAEMVANIQGSEKHNKNASFPTLSSFLFLTSFFTFCFFLIRHTHTRCHHNHHHRRRHHRRHYLFCSCFLILNLAFPLLSFSLSLFLSLFLFSPSPCNPLSRVVFIRRHTLSTRDNIFFLSLALNTPYFATTF